MRETAAALLLLAATPSAALTPPLVAPPAGVVVDGLDGHSQTLTLADLAARPHKAVSLTHEGRTTVYAGVPLSDLLREVDAPLGARMHGQAVDDVVQVSAQDGYRVALSLGEVDPSMRTGALAILADQADGKPLDAHEGPLRLVVDGDVKPARAARQVVRIGLEHLP